MLYPLSYGRNTPPLLTACHSPVCTRFVYAVVKEPIRVIWLRVSGSNRRPVDYDSTALPTELTRIVAKRKPPRALAFGGIPAGLVCRLAGHDAAPERPLGRTICFGLHWLPVRHLQFSVGGCPPLVRLTNHSTPKSTPLQALPTQKISASL